ncbi:RtcB family protein [Romboutsia sp.]|uniref:RtcB family protein n=1 Tax=Romboutsia sp. TaxID=1965302 RepID=UPI002BDF3434|nr:RtcB family protein [Romboutsia sp.]HSQ89786.1 RtcB family protein [Romboutsia sp.]
MEIKGSNNSAIVFANNVDSVTIGQIINLCNQETFKESKIRVMPDCHAGKGCTIGTTITLTDKVVPNLVGVDIGCGMATVMMDMNLDLVKIDNVIKEHIPHGFNTHDRGREKLLREVWKLDLTELKCIDAVNLNRAYKSIGTLGGGNHFIEIDKADTGELALTVHTGSRNLGKTIAEHYQRLAVEYCTEKYKDSKRPEKDLCYLEGKLMEDYLHDMEIAQKYAMINRFTILADIAYNYDRANNALHLARNEYYKIIKKQASECIHNYIDMENMILRKGAISAQKDELVIIPINMRDGIIFGLGKGNEDWNYSAPHGAGRVLSRSKAKEQVSLEEFKESMEGIFTTCVNKSTLDESPMAYKPMEDILDNIGDTVEIVDILKPIYNFKSN